MDTSNGMVNYDQYVLRRYYGPPDITEDKVVLYNFHYILKTPYLLSKEQMETILRIVSQMEKKTYRETANQVELIVPDISR